MPRFTKNCSNCGSLIKFSYKYCPQCGTAERQDDQDHYDEREVIIGYFRKGHEYSRIVELLEREHNVSMSIRTLKNRLNEYNMKRRNVNYDEQFVREHMEEILNGPGCMGGYRSVWHTLKLQGTQVPRVVEQIVRELDSEGCAERKAKRLNWQGDYQITGRCCRSTSAISCASMEKLAINFLWKAKWRELFCSS